MDEEDVNWKVTMAQDEEWKVSMTKDNSWGLTTDGWENYMTEDEYCEIVGRRKAKCEMFKELFKERYRRKEHPCFGIKEPPYFKSSNLTENEQCEAIGRDQARWELYLEFLDDTKEE